MTRRYTAGVFFHAPAGDSRASRLIREHDWTATALGPSESWPRSLHNYVNLILELPVAAIIFWGPDQIQLYNDGYAVIMGPRHPRYLGATFRACWPEAYDTIHPWMLRVLAGETVEVNRTLVPLTRYGFTEESYFTFSFSPLRDDEQRIAGILQIVTEVTTTVLAERRTSVLHELSSTAVRARNTENAVELAIQVLGTCTADLPCSLVYLVEPTDEHSFVLAGSTGLPAGHEPFPHRIDLQGPAGRLIAEFARAVDERAPVMIEDLAGCLGALPSGTWSIPPTRGMVLPIASADHQHVAAMVVVATSPQLAFDDRYREFVQLVAAQLASLLAAAHAYDEERKRVEALAALDRAKTEFFSNVSHEFRTPLTLILGPLEDALLGAQALGGESLAAVHRNALRLLRLVNTLLEFTRAESDRLDAHYEPTDLPMVTAGLAGSFQSLLESAGLRLSVDCPRSAEPAFVDRAQWERIVLNLVSNAFKFTFSGEIAVKLARTDEHFELSVADTGTGIPEHELPRIFERFHRVKDARGRSFEGSGIGLALVRELVHQHGGTVDVTSGVGRGSKFRVRIPRGDRHLPPDRLGSGAAARPSLASSFVAEASDWLRPLAPVSPVAAESPRSEARILVADDNPDMREYLLRLLAQRWHVDVVADGQAALHAATAAPPDLVVSDVMMPRLDGIALVKALRAHPRTSTVPVILLSARAGEEAIVGGLETGADDYLIKPFSARELLGRVGTHLELARLRRKAVDTANELAETRSALLDDLDRKNRELEAFSYSVSHDLRAPLRAIAGFTEVLLEDGDVLDDAVRRDLLHKVRINAQRMRALIDDLLALAQVSKAELRREPVDLTAIARRIAGELQAGDPDRTVDVRISDGMVTTADSRLVAIALENLIGNAWKFTSKRTDAEIAIECEPGGVLVVRDNGAGFDMAYSARLFEPFERLHQTQEFEGTGIGLAIVRRVVDRHGGHVWAHGEPGHGATIRMTFAPAPDPGELDQSATNTTAVRGGTVNAPVARS